ncbi:MAG: hypothetical protein ACI8RD_014743, partial [Bacillariaceae sp.]
DRLLVQVLLTITSEQSVSPPVHDTITNLSKNNNKQVL